MRATVHLALIALLLAACSLREAPSASPLESANNLPARTVQSTPSTSSKQDAVAPATPTTTRSTPPRPVPPTAASTDARVSPVSLVEGLFECPVTIPNGNNPPGEAASDVSHGNGALWTMLWRNGIILMTPQYVLPDGSFAMKFPWWLGEKFRGTFVIQGRRLDAKAPPLTADVSAGLTSSGQPFRASTLVFPTEGCWEVTARADAARLRFVTLVVSSPVQVRYPTRATQSAP